MTENEAIDIIYNKIETCEFYFAENDRYPKWCEYEFLESLGAAISAIKEVQQYREIGTVEECWEAVEKQNYMKIKTIEDMCFECPKCIKLVAHDDGWNTYNYCPNCGQKLSGIE